VRRVTGGKPGDRCGTIAKKVAIIAEHFQSSVSGELGGKAKAMIVTSSRLHAVRYKLAVDAKLKAFGSPFKALVAFTDVVKDTKGGQEYTEAKMNGFPEAGTGDIEKSRKDEGKMMKWSNLSGLFSSFILHPCSRRRIWRRLLKSGSVPSEGSRNSKAW